MILKKIAPTLLVLLIYIQTNAQDTLLPKAGQFGSAFNVTGLINNLNVTPTESKLVGYDQAFLRYYLTDNLVFRTGLGVNILRSKITTVDSAGIQEINYDSTFTQNRFGISAGIEKHLAGTKRLDPYLGLEIGFGVIGKSQSRVNVESADTIGTATVNISDDRDGGVNFQTNAIIGLNYFLAKNFSLGAEYNLGFFVDRQGGDQVRVVSNNPVAGASSTDITESAVVTNTVGFDFNRPVRLTVSWFFGKEK